MDFSQQSEFKPNKDCTCSRRCAFGMALAVVASLLVVGLTVGLAGRPACTAPPPPPTATPPGVTTENPPPGGDSSFRLPRTLFPMTYMVSLTPELDPSKLTFEGAVSIEMRCVTNTQKITVHTDQLTVLRLSVHGPDGAVTITRNETDARRMFLTVHVEPEMVAGHVYVLNVTYTGTLRNNLVGLYWGSYKDAAGLTRYFAATQFESTRARRALPCFDEPQFKANFTVQLGRRKEHKALSNMPLVSTTSGSDGWVYDQFAPSVPMSTYLLAMYVGDLDSRAVNSSLTDIETRVWARPDGMNKTVYAQSLAHLVMDGFQRYFNIPYPLPKMDHVGLPEMGPGAMENYGLIKYRETYVVVDKNTSPDAKQISAFIFAHELGHQWFGNLVTMEWWDDIWLNEGFANLCEYIGIDAVHPEWKPWEQFLYRTMYTAMTLDSLRNSRVIRQDANTPSEISANFDAISYKKGSSIMRMLRDVIGHETFRRGITRYLNKYRYKNTVSDDLWEALAEQSEEEGKSLNVSRVMQPWILQMNYPLITVTRDYPSNMAAVGQSRFLLDTHRDTEDPEVPAAFGYVWEVPLSFTNQSAQNWDNPDRMWMDKNNATVAGVGGTSDWLLVNVRRTGVYRVTYDTHNWKLLSDQLMDHHQVFPVENRAQLLDDAMQLARAGILSQTLALNITQYLVNERDLVPWRTAEDFFSLMSEILVQTKVYGGFKRYLLGLVSPILSELGWEDTGTHLDRMLRVTVVKLACLFEHPTCVSNATLLYTHWMDNPDDNRIPEGLREVAYCSAIRAGGEKEWNFAWANFRRDTDPVHRGSLRDAMTCSRHTWLLARYLSWADDTSRIRRGESDIVRAGIARNPAGRHLVWQYLQESWKTTYGKMRMATEAFNGFYTKTDVQQLEAFRDRYSSDHGSAKTLVSGAVEKAWVHFRWMERSLEEMGHWFAAVTGVPDPVFLQP